MSSLVLARLVGRVGSAADLSSGQFAIWRLRTDGSQNRSSVEMLWRGPGEPGNAETWREVHRQRWYPLPWLCAVLKGSGLHVCGVHDVVSYEPASPRTWWAHFVVRRCR
jgi:hypothetical protein